MRCRIVDGGGYLHRCIKPTYKATARLLVIQQSGHPVHVGSGNDPHGSEFQSDDKLATHVLLLKSPVIIDRAFTLNSVKSVSIGSVISNLMVKQPEPDAKVIDLVYRSKSPEEAQLVLDGVIESYKLFLKSNYQKNSSDVVGLITKARDELNAELKALNKLIWNIGRRTRRTRLTRQVTRSLPVGSISGIKP